MKTIGYLIFAGFYYIFRLLCRVKPKKVFAVMTHDGSKSGNVGVMVEYLKKKNEGYTIEYIRKADRVIAKKMNAWKGKISFFIKKPYHLATSEIVLLDNVFLPMAYIRFPKKVRVIQLWHGTGTIKRFGQDVNTGKLKELERRANSRITHLIVNSEATKKIYAGCFGVPEEKVFIYGLPRTDLFFDPLKTEEKKSEFYNQYPQLKSKKLVLYAPTFRDQEGNQPKSALDIEKIKKDLPRDYVLLLRLHPYVTEMLNKAGRMDSGSMDHIVSMSSYEDVNTLLLVSDYLITDYSSVIFEYCLLEKPIIFYAYDLEQFSDYGRGFYQPYEEYVPGPVVKDTQAILELLENNQFDQEKIRSFVKNNYRYLDGKSAERIYLHILKGELETGRYSN